MHGRVLGKGLGAAAGTTTRGRYSHRARGIVVEDHGLDPDIVVDNNVQSVLAGRDLQWEKGVAVLLEQLPAAAARSRLPRTAMLRPAATFAALSASCLLAQSPPLHVGDGATANEQAGAAVAAMGDLDRDGRPDFVVAAPFGSGNGTDSGDVRVFSGRSGALLWQVFGDAAYDHFGWMVQGGVDVDGDGYPDLLVGAPDNDQNGSDAGFVRLYSGRTRQPLWTVHGSSGDELGHAVGFCGDIDGDGTPDFGAGAPLADTPAIDAGKACVYSGRTGLVLWSAFGGLYGDHFGHQIGGVGDVDGDARDDFLVAAPWSDQVASKCGSAMVYSGRTRQVLYIWFGTALGHEFGTSFTAPGDVDGDGHADVAVAAPEDKTFGDDSGSVRVFSGATGAVLHWWYGDSAYDYFGHSIGSGDFDGDGVKDLLIGAPLDERMGVPANGGIVRVFSGATGSLVWSTGGSQGFEQLSRAVAGIGDVNGDGFCDLLCGAPYRDGAAGIDAGGHAVFAGRPAAPATTLLGTGCPSAAPLQLGFGPPARLAQPLSVQLQNGPPGLALGWLVLGIGDGHGLPRDLSFLGLPGCSQHAELDATMTLLLVNGAASTSLTVPAPLASYGIVLRLQAIVLDSAAIGGLCLSNGGRAVIAP